MTAAVPIAERVARVREAIAEAAVRAGRQHERIRLVAVSKYASVEAVAAAAAAGQLEFGENYLQDALAKLEQLRERVAEGALPAELHQALSWHFVGRLQSNKAAAVARTFDLIQTLATDSALQAVAREAERLERPVPVLIQIRLGTGAGRAGVEAAGAEAFAERVAATAGVLLDGVMGLAPLGEPARPHFASLRAVLERLRSLGLANAPLGELSAGMSDDYQEAILEGATLVRIGRAIFGED